MKKRKSYKQKALELLQSRVGKIVTSQEFAKITGSKGNPISHNMRRIFELRDEDGYDIVNHKNNHRTGLNLKVDEWILLTKDPIPSRIRPRGVNKKIMVEVFTRDGFTCQICGRGPEDDDPFRVGRRVKLHVGHINAHKSKDGNSKDSAQILISDDFITLCNVCNEGMKNNNFRKITLLDRVKGADEKIQEEVFKFLKNRLGK